MADGTTIDSLQIDINASATKSNDAIDRLVVKLDRLQTSLGKVNGSQLAGLANGVDRLGKSMQVMNTIKTADFTRLATNLAKLGSINVSALNSSASSLSHLSRAFNTLGTVSKNTQSITNLVSSLSSLGGAKVQRAIVNIPLLATAMNNLMVTLSRSPRVSNNVIQLTNALANLASQGARVGTASNSIENGLNRANRSATRASKSFGGLASAIGKFYASYFMVIRGIKGLYKSIEGTADYLEAFNYFNVALGKIGSDWSHQFEQYGYESAETYAESFSTKLQSSLKNLSGLQITLDTNGNGLLTETGLKNLGLNIQEITQYASQLASVTNSVGQVGEVSLAAANSLTKLGADLSSLFNLDYSSVMNNLQSGLIGQSRALYKYGIDITNATLQTKAYELGLSKSVSEMTQAEKMQLRMLVILQDSKVAWGDLANTINSPSNMIRQFKNNLKEVGMVLGQLFIPLMQKVMPVINGVTIALKRLLVNIAGFLGIQLDLSSFGQGYSGLGEDVDGLTDSLDDATASAKKLKSVTLGIDELNINAPQEYTGKTTGGVGGGIDLTKEILAATEEYQKVWDEAFANMENKAQEFANKVQKFFEPITIPIENLFKSIAKGDFKNAGKSVADIVNGFQTMILDAIRSTKWDKSGSDFGSFFSGLSTNLFKGMGDVSSIFSELIIGINSFLTSAIDSVDWEEFSYELMNGIQKFIDNINTIGITESITKLVKVINEAIVEVFAEIPKNSEEYMKFIATLFKLTVEFTAVSILGSIEIISQLLEALLKGFINTAKEVAMKYSFKIGESIAETISDGINSLSDGNFLEWLSKLFSKIISFANKHIKPLIKLFEPLFEYVKRSLSRVPDWFKELLITNIKSNVLELPDWFGLVFSLIGQIITQSIENKTIGIATWFKDKIVNPIIDLFAPLYERLKSIFEGIWIVVVAVWEIASGWFNENVIIPLIGFFTPIVEQISGLFTTTWEKIKEVWSVVYTWFNQTIISPVATLFENVCNKISGFFTSLWAGIKSGVATAMNAVIDVIEDAINWIVDGINGILERFNDVVEWGTDVIGEDVASIELLPKVTLGKISVPAYKFGGFPEDGWFRASKGEYFGQFDDGTSYIANNNQIEAGISVGVGQAVREAVSEILTPYLADIAQNTRETADKEWTTNFGDREIARANARGQRSLGYALIT